jgi:hypothetical protein
MPAPQQRVYLGFICFETQLNTKGRDSIWQISHCSTTQDAAKAVKH